ncbi:hypothetical protein B0H13DRAFT_1155508 [Mycena leptocephala]|nr:hypothetical protein B0H13DRAFT_1155508 [Mycena leptocephala]
MKWCGGSFIFTADLALLAKFISTPALPKCRFGSSRFFMGLAPTGPALFTRTATYGPLSFLGRILFFQLLEPHHLFYNFLHAQVLWTPPASRLNVR